MYNTEDIEKVANFKSWTEKQRIDELLRIDCVQYTNLGLDSTKAEKELVRKTSRKIYRLIKGIDHNLGQSFLNAMDDR